MFKSFTNTLPTYSTLSPQSPPFLNSIIVSKTSQEGGFITGRKILNTPLGLSSRESSENLNKFPIVIESIKGKKTPNENRFLKRIDEESKKPENSEKTHKTIQMRTQKRAKPSIFKETKGVLKEKSLNVPIEKKLKEKADILLNEPEENNEPMARNEKKISQKPKKTKKMKKPDENQLETMNSKEKPHKKPLKKKKKKKKTHKPTTLVPEVLRTVESPLPPPENPKISKLLLKSLEEFKAKKNQRLSSKKQKNLQNQEKNLNLHVRNEEIRRSNLERFLKRQDMDPFSSKSFKPAWGLDQQKFKRSYLSKFLKEFDTNPEFQAFASQSKNMNKGLREEIANDEIRRTRLGLEFLKGMSEENIELLIRRSKEKMNERDKENSPLLSKKKTYTEEDVMEIRRFMEKKREQIETQNIQTLLQDFLSQEKIKQNLQSLHQEVKGIFQSKQSKSTNKFRSSQSPPELPNAKPDDFENEEAADSKEFSLLYQEYKNFIREKSPEKPDNKTQSKIKNKKKDKNPIVLKDNNMNNCSASGKKTSNVVERYEGIKEKFDTLARRFEKYIEHKSGEEDQGGLHRNENFLENIEEEKDHLKSSDLLDSNKQEPLVPPKISEPTISNPSPNQNNNKTPINIDNDDDSSPEKHRIVSNLSKNNNEDEMDSEVWGENLQILENIAIMIQKVWRGYRTRKILDEYFEIILNGEYMGDPEMGHNEDPTNEIIMEDELEDQMESMHKENQLKKKSRSADVYEARPESQENDDYKLQEEFFNNKNPNHKIISHNVLYNKPDSKSSEEFEQDKIMHISDIMEDDANNGLSKSQEKSKEIKAKKIEELKKKPFIEENLFKKLTNEENNGIKMPNAHIIESTDEFRRKLKEELNVDDPPVLISEEEKDFHLEENNIQTDKTLEESLSPKGFNIMINEENSLEYTRPSQKSRKPIYSDSDTLEKEGQPKKLTYKKKNNLMLDVEEIEKEHEIHEKLISDISNKNSDKQPDLSEIRKTLCSEKLVREQASRSCLQFKPLKLKPNSESLEEPGFKDSRDSKSKIEENLSIFEQDPFKDFTYKLYQDVMHNDMRKSTEGLLKENYEEWKKGALEKKETPKSSGLTKKGLIEKWVNPEESLKKEGPSGEQNRWNSPFYGFKKTQRDLVLMQRTGNQGHSYYNSYYSDEGINPLGEFENLAFLSKSWHGFNSQKPSLNLINQLSDFSKNIKIIDKFEVKETKSDQEKPEANLSASSFRQPPESPQNMLNFEASSISKSRKNEGDSNRIATEEDNDFEFKECKEESQVLINNPDLSISANKQPKSPPIPMNGDENIQEFDVLPLDKSLENLNNLINNEVVIKDEQAYNKDMKVSTVANSILDELFNEFEGELQGNEVILTKFMNFMSSRQITIYRPINTTVYAVDEYLNILNNFIRERYAGDFLKNINQAYDQDPLGKLRIYNEAKFESTMKEFQMKPMDILSSEVYYELDRLIQDEAPNEEGSIELDRLHKQLLFDCMNESLEYFRPFDIRGKPSPWKLNQKKLTYSDIDPANMDIVLEQAKNKVIEWSLFQCGMLAEGNEAVMNYELLNQIKQERLEKMIINEIYEKEEKWITYDDWESVAEIEISDLILEGLVFETVKEVLMKRTNNTNNNE